MTQSLDATTLVVMSNRLDGITREMTNTVIRAARSDRRWRHGTFRVAW